MEFRQLWTEKRWVASVDDETEALPCAGPMGGYYVNDPNRGAEYCPVCNGMGHVMAIFERCSLSCLCPECKGSGRSALAEFRYNIRLARLSK